MLYGSGRLRRAFLYCQPQIQRAQHAEQSFQRRIAVLAKRAIEGLPFHTRFLGDFGHAFAARNHAERDCDIARFATFQCVIQCVYNIFRRPDIFRPVKTGGLQFGHFIIHIRLVFPRFNQVLAY